jgi:hypothetical protein
MPLSSEALSYREIIAVRISNEELAQAVVLVLGCIHG